jgi:ankyrin repeat protein
MLDDPFSSLVVDVELAVEILLELGYDPSKNRSSALRRACMTDNVNVVRLLLAHPKIDPTAVDSAALIVASSSGHYDVVKLLLNDGRADPTAQDYRALKQACKYDHEGVVRRLLLDKRITVSLNRVLDWACINGSFNIVRMLFEEGVDPNSEDQQCIIYAVLCEHSDILRFLLDDGRVDPSNNNNEALRRVKRRRDIAEMLLADPRVQSTLKEQEIDKAEIEIESEIEKREWTTIAIAATVLSVGLFLAYRRCT